MKTYAIYSTSFISGKVVNFLVYQNLNFAKCNTSSHELAFLVSSIHKRMNGSERNEKCRVKADFPGSTHLIT